MRDLNPLEQTIVDNLGEVWNQFNLLAALNEDDDKDFRYHIHSLQRMIMARPVIEKEREEKLQRYKT